MRKRAHEIQSEREGEKERETYPGLLGIGILTCEITCAERGWSDGLQTLLVALSIHCWSHHQQSCQDCIQCSESQHARRIAISFPTSSPHNRCCYQINYTAMISFPFVWNFFQAFSRDQEASSEIDSSSSTKVPDLSNWRIRRVPNLKLLVCCKRENTLTRRTKHPSWVFTTAAWLIKNSNYCFSCEGKFFIYDE